jgi:CheY-like chemotaxis protein
VRLRILVIDDEPLVRLGSVTVLEEHGHAVIECGPGMILEHLEQAQFDVVLTDLNMPGMNGWDIATWIATNRPAVPVCAVSGRIADELDPRWLRAFAAVLRKPVNETVLLRTVERLTASLRPR